MENVLLIAVAGVAFVVLVTALAPRVGVAAPLLLVVLGIGISFLPVVEAIEVEPELILGVILPPLLYSAAVNIPAMEFRRDLPLISGFSVLLVFASAFVVGLLMTWLIPDLPLPVGIALGAIVSPTDAVATGIAKKAGLSTRLATVLEGESLLNDASALVLLRSAIAAVGAALAVWEVGLWFLYAVVMALVIGYLVGRVADWVSARLRTPSLVVAVSLIIPFVAYLPAEHLGASGLVAAVVAGLVIGRRSPESLSPQTRLTSEAVWRTIELLLESAIFLLMGLELFALVEDVVAEHDSITAAVQLGAIAATAVIGVRIVFVACSLWLLARRERRAVARRDRLGEFQEKLDERLALVPVATDERGAALRERGARLQAMINRRLSDIDYLAAERFGWREGAVLVWAGMRGAITLAAAQSLPTGTPHRSLLILIAFVVAAGTLLLQGSTLQALASRLGLTGHGGADAGQRLALESELARVANARLDEPGLARADGAPYSPATIGYVRRIVAETAPAYAAEDAREIQGESLDLQLDLIRAQRRALIDLRDIGSFPSALLDDLLRALDARELGLELRRVD
ncbi:MAG: sodium:proton antiporter [Propionicimonas sp.]